MSWNLLRAAWRRPVPKQLAGVAASALLLTLFGRGGAAWLLGFVALVPWLLALDAQRSWRATVLWGWAMSVAFSAALFWWFGLAIGHYTQWGPLGGLAVLLLLAPVFQPQCLVFALVRRWAGGQRTTWLAALAGAGAWVAAEWLLPKLLGDTLGHGLFPSASLRQAAAWGGAAGLTLLLLLTNEAVAAAWHRRGHGAAPFARPLAAAALLPLALALAGWASGHLHRAPAQAVPLRVGLIQANLVDYEQLRAQHGSGAAVRQVLAIHFAMSYDAVERHKADAVLWSETVYPTTFGRPKSEAGAELDREVLATMQAAGVPFVFGTYDRDAAGEYNAAALVEPRDGVVGVYRKTRLFPLTEYVPAWLDGPMLRRWLPWTGTWQPGSGARVFPLRLSGGRAVPVQPLICLDDMDPRLAIAGARLGAHALVTLSNDAWFANGSQGARLHLAAAAFRSIETGLPQFRVTTNGFSAVIDARGHVHASAGRGERSIVISELPVGEPPRTLMVAWGDWVGRTAAVLLLFGAVFSAWRRWRQRHPAGAAPVAPVWPARVLVLPPAARVAAGALRGLARLTLAGMAIALVLGDNALQTQPLTQIRLFATLVLLPEVLAGCLLLAFAAHASVEDGQLVLRRGAQRLGLAAGEVQAVRAWRLPLPAPGASLTLRDGRRWRYGLARVDAAALAQALAEAGAPLRTPAGPPALLAYAQARLAIQRGRLHSRPLKFFVLPLLLALPAFRLHQQIAYGSSVGEYLTFGLGAYLTGFALWWATWAIAVALCAATVRAAIEAGTLATVWLRPGQAVDARRWLERAGLAVLYLGMPAWLSWRVLGG